MPVPEEIGEAAELKRDAESALALEHGGLPVTALQRIREAEESGGTWSSDLSVAELAAVRGVGFTPVGLVMGSSIYHIGYQWGPRMGMGMSGQAGIYAKAFPCLHGYYHDGMQTGYNWEHKVFEVGITTARNLAMGRLVAEAQALGAHGVVGLRLTFSRPAGSTGNVEFVAIGTAVRRVGAPPLAMPFTCHLTGQDFAKLMRTGYVPAALVLGVAAIEVDPGCSMEFQERSYQNQELRQSTEAMQACREIAVAHLEHEASLVGDGVVGVEVAFSQHRFSGGSHLFELQATGTAVRKFADEPLPEAPLAILRLGGVL
jgi:uncharacterized protein YbjQ (UPF0145 family)